MNIQIRVFKNGILVRVNEGQVHVLYSWIMVLDLIRENDYVIVQNYTGEN